MGEKNTHPFEFEATPEQFVVQMVLTSITFLLVRKTTFHIHTSLSTVNEEQL